MTQEISYRIRFSFPRMEEERERMLPSVDLFLRALEEVDRLLAGTLGLEVDYRRALKEFGEESFFYSVGLTLRWPRQILLGAWPDPASLRLWMESARNDLLRDSEEGPGRVGENARLWDARAAEMGLAKALLYTPLAAERLKPFSDDIARAVTALGGRERVVFE